MEYMAPPSPDTAKVRWLVPMAAATAAGKAKPSPPGALTEVELAILRIPRRPRPVGRDRHVPERLCRSGNRGAQVAHQRHLGCDVLAGQSVLDGATQTGGGPGTLPGLARGDPRGNGRKGAACVGMNGEGGVVGLEDPRFGV